MLQESYSPSFASKYGSQPSTQSNFDVDLWVEAAGGSKKGRVYGFGDSKHVQSVTRIFCSVTSQDQGGSSSAVPAQPNIELIREAVREEMRQEFDERMRKANEEMEQRLRAMILQQGGNRPGNLSSSVSLLLHIYSLKLIYTSLKCITWFFRVFL